MTMSRLTYILGFSVKFFFQPIYTDYRNQKMTTKEISIFSNSSHFEWMAELSDTLLEGDHTRTIPAKFVIIWV
jgi:hypothetical protein